MKRRRLPSGGFSPINRLMLALLSICALSATAALAQATLAPGESRANRHQYLASHNAYQGDISLTQALDVYNVWEIELDVRWRDDAACLGGGSGFYILHHCADPAGEGWLGPRLQELAATKRMEEGFFFLTLELGDDYVCLGCLEGPEFPSNYLDLLRNEVLAAFGVGVYTWQDFVADGMKWPSVQELLRRGKHVAVNANFPDGASTFFFKRASVFGSGAAPIVVWNTPDQSLAIPATGDRYMTRRYPQAYCVIEDGDEWVAAYNNGFTFPSTNCIEFHADTNRDFFHPPLPTHANPSGTGGLGTYGSPYRGGAGLVEACQRFDFYNDLQCSGAACQSHPAIITVEMDGGAYTVTSGGPVVFNCPMVLAAPSGPATLH